MTKNNEEKALGEAGRIIVHIGLPKTATTTLQQEVFPSLSDRTIQYVGVMQPRARKQTELYQRLRQVVDSGEGSAELNQLLVDALREGATLLVSEEMLTVSSNGVVWRKKLGRLASILSGLDYSILVTVREPTAAMFSYYVEVYEAFAKKKKSFQELATTDERMEIFHYRKFTDALFATFDRDRIFVYRFEDVVAGNNEALCRLITANRQGWDGLVPPRNNDRRRVGKAVYSNKKVTLADIPRRLLILLGIGDTPLIRRSKALFRPLARRLDRVELSERLFHPPPESVVQRLKTDLGEETAALDERFGVRY